MCYHVYIRSELVIPIKVDLVTLPVSLLDQHGSLLYRLQEQARYFDLVLCGGLSPEGDIALSYSSNSLLDFKHYN